ncbi:MAG: hypothetical protein U0Y10_00715 [Spirosomataceae bacterium]
MATHYKSILFFVLAAGLLSCAEPLYQLNPTANEYIYNEGRKVVKQAKDDIKIVTSFDGEFERYLVFDTELFNQTDHAIEVKPSDFVAFPLDKNRDTLRNERFPDYPLVYSAADPDQKIIETEENLRKAKRQHTFATVLNVVLLVANAASDVSSSNKARSSGDWMRNRITHDTNYQLLAVKQSVDDATYVHRMERLQYERGNWEAEPFRKQTLSPGTSIRGRIYVPKKREAAYWLFNYPLANGAISFEFEQITSPRP